MPAQVLSLDFETCSQVDLRRTGVYPYARDTSTQVICMAYAFDDDPVSVWRQGQPFPLDVLDHVARRRPVRAWNATFELEIWNNTLLPQITGGISGATNTMSPQQVYDTMAQAAYYGLPLGLDMAAAAAGTAHQKDKTGHALMMRMNRPRKVHPDGRVDWWHLDDPAKLDALCAYCAQDVETERAIARTLPPLPDEERRIWLLDNRINAHGVAFDLDAIDRLTDVADAAKGQLNAELAALTGGQVKSLQANTALLGWLRDHGYPHNDLRRPTVDARLADPNCKDLERLALEIRSAGARTSASKLDAMRTAAAPLPAANAPGAPRVGVIRGMLQHYGAFRTGRWAGRLVQPQNLPRPTLKQPVIEMFLRALEHTTDPRVLEAMFGGLLAAVASSLRGCIVPRPGRKLAVADFSQIEARVVAWLAGEDAVLHAFRTGQDVYKLAAAGIFNCRPEEVTPDQRQIGKVAVLALGYGGGKGAFKIMAAAYGMSISDAEAEEIKVAWRAANAQIVRLWHELERACKDVIQNGGVRDVGRLRVGMWGPHMAIRLPSGRSLFYRDVRLDDDDDGFGPRITYMGLNQYTQKWERLDTYGGKLVENVTQATARDCMAHVMLEADDRGHQTILTVHDELLTEPPAAEADARLDDLLGLMAAPIPWAPGLPTKGDGWVGDRYRK